MLALTKIRDGGIENYPGMCKEVNVTVLFFRFLQSLFALLPLTNIQIQEGEPPGPRAVYTG